VERVFRTRPSGRGETNADAMGGRSGGEEDATATGDGGPGGRKTGKKSKKEVNEGRKGRGFGRQSSMGSSKSLSGGGGPPRFVRGPTDLDEHLDSLESSVRAINLRISILCEYLAKVERGEDDADAVLLRSIDGLVIQLPLVLASLEDERASSTTDSDAERTPLREIENEYGDAMLLTYLAAVTKTARAVHVYSEKFRIACEGGKGDPHRRPHY
jgi:hypothetical protein